jgi:hypothetical protein
MRSLILTAFSTIILFASASAQITHIRINQAGYLPADTKVAIAFSDEPITSEFTVRDVETKRVTFTGNSTAP